MVAIAAGRQQDRHLKSDGRHHSLALRSDGTVVAWGYNMYGQCNISTGLKNVQAITAGGARSIALKTDGTLVAWGHNQFGQCNIPTGLKDVTAIAAGDWHSLALVKR